MPYGTKLEVALICNLNFIFCHYTMNHPIVDVCLTKQSSFAFID